MADEQSTVEYREVEGFPAYRVGNDGSVWSSHSGAWRKLRPRPIGDGYLSVQLCRDGVIASRYIHHLVLLAFIGPKPDGMECLHGDHDRRNNRSTNVRWGTHLENVRETVSRGTHKNYRRPPAARDDDIVEIRSRWRSGEPCEAIAASMGYGYGTVWNVVNHRGVYASSEVSS